MHTAPICNVTPPTPAFPGMPQFAAKQRGGRCKMKDDLNYFLLRGTGLFCFCGSAKIWAIRMKFFSSILYSALKFKAKKHCCKRKIHNFMFSDVALATNLLSNTPCKSKFKDIKTDNFFFHLD
jgi:hypothetical protein